MQKVSQDLGEVPTECQATLCILDVQIINFYQVVWVSVRNSTCWYLSSWFCCFNNKQFKWECSFLYTDRHLP